MGAEHFTFKFTLEQIEELIPYNSSEWYEALCEVLPLWEITTPQRVAGFIAQCGHESAGFKVLTENLNYSAKALNAVFPKYFERAGRDAEEYARQPEKIANVVYANRMDNGDEDSGDGWKFRGGGLIQLTGKHNYTQFAKVLEMSLDDALDYVRTKKGAIDSACWFWDTNNINRYCDNDDIVGMTKRINGGTNGLDDRTKHWKHALEVFDPSWTPSARPVKYETIRKGSRGPLVVEVQEFLGTSADGIFGAGTERLVKEWQAENGLVADGIVGPNTLEKMLG